jgi:hypothetical protein
MVSAISGNLKVRCDRCEIIFKYPGLLNAGINNMQRYFSRLVCINDADPKNTARSLNINYFYFKREMSILIVILIIIYKMQARKRIGYIDEYSEKIFVL